jgi:hypothetical protein
MSYGFSYGFFHSLAGLVCNVVEDVLIALSVSALEPAAG